MNNVTFKVSGVTHERFPEAISLLIVDAGLQEFELERINHPMDPNAIKILASGVQFGWVPRHISKILAPLLDKGECYTAFLVQVNTHPGYETRGVTVKLKTVAM